RRRRLGVERGGSAGLRGPSPASFHQRPCAPGAGEPRPAGCCLPGRTRQLSARADGVRSGLCPPGVAVTARAVYAHFRARRQQSCSLVRSGVAAPEMTVAAPPETGGLVSGSDDAVAVSPPATVFRLRTV